MAGCGDGETPGTEKNCRGTGKSISLHVNVFEKFVTCKLWFYLHCCNDCNRGAFFVHSGYTQSRFQMKFLNTAQHNGTYVISHVERVKLVLEAVTHSTRLLWKSSYSM